MSIGRETVPRVHGREVAVHFSRDASRKRHNVEVAVRAHEQAVLVLHEDNPLAVGRDFREIVAQPVLRGADNSLRLAALPIVERDAIEVVMHLSLIGIVGILGGWLAGRKRIFGLGSRKNQVLAVWAPKRAGVDVLRIVGSRQRF